jgi:L-methionine (R)-S-oxide reductase
MAEDINVGVHQDKESRYEELWPQLVGLLENEQDLIAAMANTAAALHSVFGWLWVGFYRVQHQELVLGPFQGPVACTRIGFGRGVCGTAWERKQIQIVPDVARFPGHIACSSLSRSEIVVPLFNDHGEVVAVLDVDSADLNTFDNVDADWLKRFVELLPIR